VDRQKQYVASLGGLIVLTTVGLSALREYRLEVYVSLFTVCYFAASALFRPRRRWLDVVGAALFLVFCYVVALKILDILF
jgi:Ca2+/Na+ antiporter